MLWLGTREQLDAWKQYKRAAARAFVEKGYSVQWAPDPSDWFDVYMPERPYARALEVRAETRLFPTDGVGLKGSRVRSLTIYLRELASVAQPVDDRSVLWKEEHVSVVFNTGKQRVDRLDDHSAARALYDVVLEELR